MAEVSKAVKCCNCKHFLTTYNPSIFTSKNPKINCLKKNIIVYDEYLLGFCIFFEEKSDKEKDLWQ
jgi:hypothetical protein